MFWEERSQIIGMLSFLKKATSSPLSEAECVEDVSSELTAQEEVILAQVINKTTTELNS